MNDLPDPVASMPIPETFTQVTALVLAFVTSQPGAQQALLDHARTHPEDVTFSLLTLGAVLLDISAGAFHLTPEDMLDKVARGIVESH